MRQHVLERIDNMLHMLVLVSEHAAAALVVREHGRVGFEYKDLAVRQKREIDAAVVQIEPLTNSLNSVHRALAECGHTVELTGVHGVEVYSVLAHVREAKYDMLFNLCESMDNNSLNEPTFAGQIGRASCRESV